MSDSDKHAGLLLYGIVKGRIFIAQVPMKEIF
jgi:hypothetical protein